MTTDHFSTVELKKRNWNRHEAALRVDLLLKNGYP